MKRVTATQARRIWFRLLDEVSAGEVVVIERGGRRVILRKEDDSDMPGAVPSYDGLIEATNGESADRWTWDWSEDGSLVPGLRGEEP